MSTNLRFGERSAKRRTYSFTRDEVVDHQTGLKVHGVRRVLDGDLDALITSARLHAATGEQGGKNA
jgi:protein subunit release factor A